MLEGHDITLHFGPRRVLDRVSFAARPGAVTAIVGPNGSGKTTLLRALSGEVASTGRITLNGRDVRGLPAAKLAAMRAVLPQRASVAFPFTAREVVRIGQSFGLHTSPALALRALDRVGLLHLADRPYPLLSGGEQARVQLARVLVQVWEPVVAGMPRWLFLDEPVASLDIGHQMLVMEIARDFANRGGGVLAVMHDLNLTAMFAGHILLLAGGRIRAAGDPAWVLTSENLSAAYGCSVAVRPDLPGDMPFILPQGVRPLAGAA